MKYAIIENETNTIKGYKDLPDDFVKADVSHKYGSDKELDLKKVVVEDKPTFNPDIESLVTDTIIQATQVKETKTVVRLSDEEISRNIDRSAEREIYGLTTSGQFDISTIVALFLMDRSMTGGVNSEQDEAILDGFRPVAEQIYNIYIQAQQMKAQASTISDITFT